MDHGIEKAVGAALAEDSINISDVIEVIETDPDFTNQQQQQMLKLKMFSGGNEIKMSQSHRHHNSSSTQRPYVVIKEQPASKALRFRYECEGRSAGSIPGVNSTPESKSYPTIQVVGYQGRAMVVVSCVTKDEPYKPHPHNLVGREGCKRGVCTLDIPTDTMTVQFSNLGIQCVKKKDIDEHLRMREEIRVDPFRTGFAHRNQPTTIDLNAVRLCFQVFIEQAHTDSEGNTTLKFTRQLDPVISDPIFDKKAMSDLVITHLCSCTTTVAGARDDTIILLCEKVAKEDIQVRFYEEKDGRVVWEGLGEFPPSHVHKQVAIKLRTPRYHTLDVTEPVKVFVQLRRPSDGATSEPRPFMFKPLDSVTTVSKGRKRPKHDMMSSSDLLREFKDKNPSLTTLPPYSSTFIPNHMDTIKQEPGGGTSPYNIYAGGLSPSPRYAGSDSLSPQPSHTFLGAGGGSPLGQTSPSPEIAPQRYVNANLAVGGMSSVSPMHDVYMPPNIPPLFPDSSMAAATSSASSMMNVATASASNATTAAGQFMALQQSMWSNIPGPAPAGPQVESVTLSDMMINDLNCNPEFPLEDLNLNSRDLVFMDTNNLSANLSAQCSIKMEEIPISTDSITRLTNETFDNIKQLNASCNPTAPEKYQ